MQCEYQTVICSLACASTVLTVQATRVNSVISSIATAKSTLVKVTKTTLSDAKKCRSAETTKTQEKMFPVFVAEKEFETTISPVSDASKTEENFKIPVITATNKSISEVHSTSSVNVNTINTK